MNIRLVFLLCFFLLCSFSCHQEGKREFREVFGSRQQAIIGGKVDNRYPAVGSLVPYRLPSFCTATLIAPKLLLTAGHCNDELQKFVTSTWPVYFHIEVPRGKETVIQKYQVETSMNHPDWLGTVKKKKSYDIGVVVLKKAVEVTAPMQVYFDEIKESWVGKNVLYMGYGLTQTIPKVVRAKRKHSTEIPIALVKEDRFTTFKKGTSPCNGDSGGPAFAWVGPSFYIAGIVSYGTGDKIDEDQDACNKNATSMSLFRGKSWILEQVKKFGGLACTEDNDCGPCYVCVEGTCKHTCREGGVCAKNNSHYVCFDEPHKEPPVCGDGVCGDGENCLVCAKDCKCREGQACTTKATCKPKAVCGDGFCDSTQNESCETCSSDCYCEPTCGDGTCHTDRGENCETCSSDCGCKNTQECKKQQCVEKKEDGGKAKSNELQCDESQRVTTCDDQGKNCKTICSTGVGCSTLTTENPPWSFLFFLFAFLLVRLRR